MEEAGGVTLQLLDVVGAIPSGHVVGRARNHPCSVRGEEDNDGSHRRWIDPRNPQGRFRLKTLPGCFFVFLHISRRCSACNLESLLVSLLMPRQWRVDETW